MSDIKTISRQLYTDSIKHIYSFRVVPNSELLNVDKIWNILFIVDLYVKEADRKSAIPVKLSKDIKIILDTHRNIFFSYLFVISPNLSPIESINKKGISNDSRNQYIFDSLFNSLSNTLNSYLSIDEEFGLKNSKDSLEALFALLLINLNSYRSYFKVDIPSAFSNYSLVNSILSENSDQKSKFFNSPNTIDKSIAINSVNINNPVPYASRSDWKQLFNNLYSAVSSSINSNIQTFYVKNTLINSLEAILSQEKANFDSKVNFVSPFTFEGKEITENEVKKIQITSSLTSNIDVSTWLNHSVIYLNGLNASTKSKITKIEGNKLTLTPYASLSSSKIFSFLTIKEGINIEKDFQTFSINNSNPTLFSLDVITGTNTLRTINFRIEEGAFKSNFINFPVAKSNPLSNGWTFDNGIETPNVTFYRDITNNSFILNKGNVNSRNLKLYYNFSIESFDNNNQIMNINFDYKILSPNFNPSNLILEICSVDRGNDITLKTLKPLGNNFNTNLKFNDTFNTITPINGTYSITSGDCIVTAQHKFSVGQSVYLRFTSGDKPQNNYYIIKSITSNSFTVKVLSGSGTGNCNYSVKTSNNYKFKITFNDFNEELKISFNNFYVGLNNINTSTITYNNPKKLINDLFLSQTFKNNRDCFFSYSQITNVDDNGVSTTRYKMKLSSEPIHTGSQKKFKFYNINPNLNWLLSEGTLSGLDPIKIVDTGFEKKYYDSFISLNKRVFSVINSYALSRLLVPEIFDEEQSVFNLGVKVDADIKGYFSELLDELKDDFSFKGDLLRDPRSNFLGSGEPVDALSRSVEWKSGGVKDALGLKQFTKFKSQLEKIKSALKKVKSILEAIKAFIEILEELIEMGEDLLGALLDQVIKQVEKVVDNIASTGVYWLPVIQYFELASTSKWWTSEISNSLLQSPIENPYAKDSDVIVSPTFLKEIDDLQKANKLQFQDDLDMDASRVKGSKERKNTIVPFLPFRSTTYEEFIDVIISGLLDEGDLPELGLEFTSDGKTTTKKTLGFTSSAANFIRPGAPKWTSGSQSAVILVAICLPAPEDLIAGWEAFLRSLLLLLKPIRIAIKLLFNSNGGFINTWIKDISAYLGEPEQESSSDPQSEAAKQAKQLVNDYLEETEFFSSKKDNFVTDIADWWNQSTILDEALEDRGGKFSGSRGTYPDFLGFSIGSAFPGLFSIVKGFLRKLKKLNEKESVFTLTEKFEKLVEPITNFIDDIEDIIKSIDDIINAIDAILNINISYLVIKTNNGIPDIVNQIEDATGFPNEDKRQIILGGLLGAGFVSPTGNEFNFSGYIKEATDEFNEDAKDLFGDLKESNQDAGIGFLNKFFGS